MVEMIKWSFWEQKKLDLTLTECHTICESLKNGNRFVLSSLLPETGKCVISVTIIRKNKMISHNEYLYYVDNSDRRRLLRVIKEKLGRSK
jgi:hypothetical protein